MNDVSDRCDHGHRHNHCPECLSEVVGRLQAEVARLQSTLAAQCDLNSAMQRALGMTCTDGTDSNPVKWCEGIAAEVARLTAGTQELTATIADQARENDQLHTLNVSLSDKLATASEHLRALSAKHYTTWNAAAQWGQNKALEKCRQLAEACGESAMGYWLDDINVVDLPADWLPGKEDA